MIKPIETKYKGYRFRSRLEARWAVFFDAIGIEWEYEPEGFDLGDAGWYLPDFYLPVQGAWIEIKPKNGEREQVQLQLNAMIDLGVAESGQAWGLFGDPLSAWWMMPCKTEAGYQNEWPNAGIGFCDIGTGCLCAVPTFKEGGLPTGWAASNEKNLIENFEEKVLARSARFEHGETPG